MLVVEKHTLEDAGRSVFYSKPFSHENEYYDTWATDPDVGRTTEQYIKSRHFDCEKYHMTTSDGYILPAYRIVNPYNKNKKPYPILMTVSTLLDVNQWLWSYGGNAVPPKDPGSVKEGAILNSNMPYALSNHGYDVWLFNTRGVGDDLNHTHLSIYSVEYWKFSADELIQIDLPRAIDFVMSVTKQKHIGYIGYSLSSAVMVGTLSYHPKYNRILKPVILFGFGNIASKPYNTLASDVEADILRAFPGPLLPKFKLTSTVLTAFCSPPVLEICAQLLMSAVGYDSNNLNRTRFPVYLSQFPAGTSTWEMAHASQISRRGNCYAHFDYGQSENEKKYGQDFPPCYDLKQVTNKYIGAFLGLNDKLTPYGEDELKLFGVNPVFEKYVIPDASWSHADYMVAKSIGRYIVPKVLRIIHRALTS
ncbi:Lysosomal acid lipase/cholesteryl ester hydrolase [Halotydeus destructor]|nr:Lysosomal acid lipase/cholesteryl ester hydrolase [Halotydeus destructor]